MFVIIGWVVALGCVFGVFIAHGGNISDVPFDQPAAEHGAAMTRREIVVDDDLMAGLAQRLRGVAADIAGATGHENHVGSGFSRTIGQISAGQWSSR